MASERSAPLAQLVMASLAVACTKESEEFAQSTGVLPTACGSPGARLQATIAGDAYCANGQVEDEEQLRKIIKMNLELDGYEVIATDNGRKALELAEGQHFDLMVLDVMLPEVNGFQICEQVRLRNSKVGIIIISAKDTSNDRITGLKLGADDYLTKPFNLEELLLRVQNLLKRSSEENAKDLEKYSFSSNDINFVTYDAHSQNGEFRLTKKEVLLLKLLIERQGEVVSGLPVNVGNKATLSVTSRKGIR